MSSTIPVGSVVPLPEAIDGLAWQIQESSRPHVNFASPHMAVPLSDTERAQYLRLHEMGHVKWTPRKKDPNKVAHEAGCTWSDIQACEDGRIHHMLRHQTNASIAAQLDPGGLSDTDVGHILRRILREKNQLEPFTQMLVSTRGTGDYNRIFDQMTAMLKDPEQHGLDPEMKKNLRYLYDNGFAVASQTMSVLGFGKDHRSLSFNDTIRAAKFLRDLLGAKDMSGTEKEARKKSSEEAAERGMVTIPKEGDRISDEFMEKEAMACATEGDGAIRSGKWGDMAVRSLPMTEALKKAGISRRPRPYEHGSNPRFIHRLPIDGNVFAMKRKAEGGTVLIDTSGSMHLSDEHINRLIEAAPCAMIAIYSGNGNEGALHILANKGQRASAAAIRRAIEETGGGNIVDGPALYWLGKQTGPRIWVCDGHVTGRQDASYANLTAEAINLRSKFGIIRVPTVKDAAALFERIKTAGVAPAIREAKSTGLAAE